MVVKYLSEVSGVGESALRLLLAILIGYPVALLYKSKFLKPITSLKLEDAVHVRNNFILVTSLSISLFYNGYDIVHSLLTCTVTYALAYYFGHGLNRRSWALVLIFLFNMGYLFFGYIYHADMEYDLTWTMPQCVLCLRMIGFGFDFLDGTNQQQIQKNTDAKPKSEPEPSKLDSNVKVVVVKPKGPVSFSGDCSLPELPRFLHFLGYAYFYSAFLVGPQFSFKLYERYLKGETLTLNKDNKLPEGSGWSAFKCFSKGIFYLALQLVLDSMFPSSYLFTEEFKSLNFFKRLIILWFSAKGMITKYLGIWTLNEGSCILSGLSFNGYHADGTADWSGLTNIDTYKFETVTSLTQVIDCFNINTNFWVKQYIFKRLRFLNNKNLSQLGSLVFLSLWHGFHTGYLVCFTLEFVDVIVETKFTKLMGPHITKLTNNVPGSIYLISFAQYIYTTSALFYALLAFGLLKYKLYSQVYANIYYIGHIIVFVLYIISLFVKPVKVAKEEKVKKTN